MTPLKTLALFTLMFGSLVFARPSWISFESEQKGKVFKLVCSSKNSPSIELGRIEALNQCRSVAANQVNSDFKLKSLVIETEEATHLHQQMFSEKQVRVDCRSTKEYHEESEGTFNLWILAECPLDKAKVVNIEEPADEASGETLVKNGQELGITDNGQAKAKVGSIAQDSSQIVFISSTPKCRELLIVGKLPRSVKCSENPVSVRIDKSDRQIIVRAKGRLPKTIELNQNRVLANRLPTTIEVFLDVP